MARYDFGLRQETPQIQHDLMAGTALISTTREVRICVTSLNPRLDVHCNKPQTAAATENM